MLLGRFRLRNRRKRRKRRMLKDALTAKQAAHHIIVLVEGPPGHVVNIALARKSAAINRRKGEQSLDSWAVSNPKSST